MCVHWVNRWPKVCRAFLQTDTSKHTMYRVPCTLYHIPHTIYQLPCAIYLQEEGKDKHSKQTTALNKAAHSSTQKRCYGSLAGMLVHHLLQAMQLGGSSGWTPSEHHSAFAEVVVRLWHRVRIVTYNMLPDHRVQVVTYKPAICHAITH